MRLQHAGGAATTTLSGPIGSTDMAFTVDDASGYPDGSVGPFWVVLNPGTASEEKVLCASRSGNNFTVQAGGRGGDDTVAVAHEPPAEVRHVFTAEEADAANAHVESTMAVHGVTGAVVGTTNAQTLSNKSISGSTNTLTGIQQSSVVNLVGDLAGLADDIADVDAKFLFPFLIRVGANIGNGNVGAGSIEQGITYTTSNGDPGNWSFTGWLSSQFEIPVTGYYRFSGQMAYSTPDATDGQVSYRFSTGVTGGNASSGSIVANDSHDVNGSNAGTLHLSFSVRLTAGTRCGFAISNGSNKTVTILDEPTRTFFSGELFRRV